VELVFHPPVAAAQYLLNCKNLKQMLNKDCQAGTEAQQRTNDKVATSSHTIGKPNVSCRLTSKELFNSHSTFKDPLAWHVWEMAFDLGNTYSKQVISDFINDILSSAKNKFENNKHRPLSEASIEAETCIQVCDAILKSI
jgi:hypothetical protein